jgi:tetratricopeptide (TPR) repeat protein
MSTDAVEADGRNSTLSGAFETDIDAFGLTGQGPSGSDPNDSFELRDMVSVAASYFDRGMVDDADEMLQEALRAGYTRPDGEELNRRIRAIQDDSPVAGSLESPEVASDDATVIEFTIPLPGEDVQSAAVRRAISYSTSDIASGRLQSAHDATLHTLSIAPSYFPMYIRLAELRHALGDNEGSATIIGTLNECLASWDDDADWQQLSLRHVIDPGDAVTHRRLARSLLSLHGTVQLEPFVPEAIERAMDSDPVVALELATEYLDISANSEHALILYLRSIVASGDIDAITRAVSADVSPASPSDLLYIRSAIAYAESQGEWLRWLELAVARLLAYPGDLLHAGRAFSTAQPLIPPVQHGLSAAILSLAGGDASRALGLLELWQGPVRRETSNTKEMLLAACARAFALREISPIESIGALANAVAQAVVIDVRPYAESCRLFARPITAEALMAELVSVARETGQQDSAIQHLQALRDRMPEHLEIRTGLADLQIAAGRVPEGVRELRYIAERYEQAGNTDRMVDAMRHISNAVPTNTEMKAKLIEGYIQRGIPDEATRELRLLGDLHLERGRNAEAAAAYSRGADIAATTGNVRRAMDLFDRAVAADPEDVGVRHASVAFYVMNGAVDQATRQLKEIVRIAINREDPDEAVAALHQVIGLTPSDTAAYHRLGEVLTTLGEYTQAERVYRRLATLTPDDPVLSAKQAALAALAEGR